jgi:hypothetical protein
MAVEAPYIIAIIGVVLAFFIGFAVLMTNTQQALGYANSIRSYNPPIINGTFYCPGGTIINPYINASGLYKCGPCLIYIYPNATVHTSCPR